MGLVQKIIDKPIRSWRKQLPGVPAFIIGNAPSLLEHDLSLISDYFSIGVNRAYGRYLNGFDPTILMWQDALFWLQEKEWLPDCTSLKVCRNLADPEHLFYNFRLINGIHKFAGATDFLYGRGNSGALAVQFAVALGCEPIVLLGCDCTVMDEQTDFYGKNKDWTKYTLPLCMAGLQFIKDECPVKVISCGKSVLWNNVDLPTAIEQIIS